MIEKNKQQLEKTWSQRKTQMGILALICIVALLTSIWNANDLKQNLNLSTQDYLEDVTTQMTNDISSTMKDKMNSLYVVADSIPRNPAFLQEEVLIDYLNRKADILGFDPLIYLDKDGNYITSTIAGDDKIDGKKLLEMPSIQASFHNEISASYLEGESIFYTAPILDVHGEVNHVLVGVRSQSDMQSMINSKNFGGQTISCIIEDNGKPVLLPENAQYLIELQQFFQNSSTDKDLKAIEKMVTDIKNKQDGFIEFVPNGNTNTFLAYNSLGLNNWVLLTLIPADLISGVSDAFIWRTYLIIACVSFIFLLLLSTIYRSHASHQETLINLAFTDPITKGLNNTAFQVKYKEALPHLSPSSHTLIYMDAKDFSLVNTRFRTQTANQMLAHYYKTIEDCISKDDFEFVTRSETNHFFVLLKANSQEDVQKRMSHIIERINLFENTDCPNYEIAFTMGAVLIKDLSIEIARLQDHARIAASTSLHFHMNQCSFYDESITEKRQQNRELYAWFDDSIKNHDFSLYFQAKVDLKTRLVAGAEALVRWYHPQMGFISPGKFIPFFEQNGNICQLDVYIFEAVCQFIRKRLDENKPVYPISVNLSKLHFNHPDFLNDFIELTKKYQIPPKMIQLELTESVFFDGVEEGFITEAIQKMHRFGFTVSVDDFGVGSSSLSMLKDFDIDAFKYDMSFFSDLSNERGNKVLRCMANLAKELNLKTVAEGIETEEQLKFLEELECTQVQGYIFSKPLPASEFDTWIDEFNNR